MNLEEKISRINELYHKSQREGLTEAEKQEQQALRREYVENVRANLRGQLEHISVQRQDGTVEKLRSREEIRDRKSRIRREALARREALTDQERERGRVLLTERILGHQWFYMAQSLLCFVSTGTEIDTGEILREALRLGKRVYVPRVAGREGTMEFYRILSLDELSPGYGGILEPPAGEAYRHREGERALMLMPGAAFDPQKGRLGYGKGFYDRYLAQHRPLAERTIAVGFQCQMTEEIPQERTDIRPCQAILA